MSVQRLLIPALGLALVVAACGGASSTAGPTVGLGTPAVPTAGPASSPGTGLTTSSGTAPTARSVPTPGRTPLPSSAATATPEPAATAAAPQPSAAAIDVCGLFTGDELATLTGHKLVSTIPGPQSVDPYGCEWDFETPDAGVYWTIDIGVWPNAPQQYFEGGKAYAVGTPVPGVGDDAYLVGSDSVTALSGGTEIDVQYVNLSDDPGIDQVPITVAQDVIQRLPH